MDSAGAREPEGPSLPPPGVALLALWLWVNCSTSLGQFLPSEGHVWGAWHSHPTCTGSSPPFLCARPVTGSSSSSSSSLC